MERVLQFGTGMLLRAINAAAVDAANLAGTFDGSIVVIQSTSHGVAELMNRQQGEFTLLEQGVEHGAAVQRVRPIRAISRALLAETEWDMIREVATRPELRVIVSNVTEAGFRLDDEPAINGFPARLTDLLHARFEAIAHGPSLFVIPTELVPDNGARLAAMVDTLAQRLPDADAFREWLANRVHFCSSLVDRITTGTPTPEVRDKVELELAHPDALITATELHSLWAIEGDPAALRDAFPVDVASAGAVIFAPDITFYRERKLRLLNGSHTALAPLALMSGVHTVREVTVHPVLGPLLRQVLFDEIAPSTDLTAAEGASYAQSVLDRFANPWLNHDWRVIATNQTAKLRLRVVPSILAFVERFGRLPPGLVRAMAASLRYVRATSRIGPEEGEGWWHGASYHIVDIDFDLIDWHWRSVDSTATAAAIPERILARFTASVLSDANIWGRDLAAIPGMREAVTKEMMKLESQPNLRTP